MYPACSTARNQVTILGINSLFGKVVSFLLKQSATANKLVLYDEVDTRVAHDVAEIPTSCKIVVYNGEEQLRCAVKNSDVILIADKDDWLANEDEAINRKAADIVKYAQAVSFIAPKAVVLIAATPVNSLLPLFAEAQIGCGTFDSDRVMGVTSADTMRASTLLARHIGRDPEKAYLPVIGGSSADTRIPLFSQSRPTINVSKSDLRNLTRAVKMTEDDLKRLLSRGEALNKAYATVQLIDSVMSALRGQRNVSEIVLSRTCLVPNVDYFSLPVILGPRGIAHRFPLPPLTERETILLDHAVKHLEIDKMKGINALSGDCCIPQPPEMTEKYSDLINCCQNDLVGSLMEKFRIGVECPEVCEPRVEFKLLSKVKLKLPPDSNPSALPKRTKFIEPDTPPQDGCCPLKLPCPPVPPIRGLNQIQAKPRSCERRDKPKACKCIFPPVEKSLVPCKLCSSNKPCVEYEDFKTFYDEHRNCCGPVSCIGDDSPCDVALLSEGSRQSSAHQTPSVYVAPQNEPNQPVTCNGSDLKALSIAPVETAKDLLQQPKMISLALTEYPKANVSQRSYQAATDQMSQPDTRGIEVRRNHPNSNEAAPETVMPLYSSSSETVKEESPDHRSHMQDVNKITQSRTPKIQHEDPNWAFTCSTALCLDVLAPKQPEHQSAESQSAKLTYHISKSSGPQKHSEQHNARSTNVNPHNLDSGSPSFPQSSLQDENATYQQQPRKSYNYSSGVSLKNPKGVLEKLKDENSTLFRDADEPKSPGGILVTGQTATGSSMGKCEVVVDHSGPTGSKAAHNGQTLDENVKGRMYAKLKVIDDIKADQNLPTSNKKPGLSLSQHFNDEPEISSHSKESPKTEESSENSIISMLKERAKAINANLELQRGLRASLERSNHKRRRDNLGLGDLIDTINPAKRLPKRLESRPALRKAYREWQKKYEDPKQLGYQGKSASILITPEPDHKEKSLVVVENPRESMKQESRIDRIKTKIQAALRRIIYPVDTQTEIKPADKPSRHQKRLSQKLVTRQHTRKTWKISKAKQDFIAEMRKMDPAYTPTTRVYAPKCPTRLLFDDHPENHAKMITFNNVLDEETTGRSARTQDHIPSSNRQRLGEESSREDSRLEKGSNGKSVTFPSVPDFPELILRDSETKGIIGNAKKMRTLQSRSSMPRNPEPQNRSKEREVCTMDREPQGMRFSGVVRGDYVRHFETQILPKDANRILPESVKAAIRECSRNIATPGSLKAQRRNDTRYKMTSPNRLTYEYSRKPSCTK